jgi:hypothetical protein
MTKQKLEILSAFVMMSRHAVDRLRDEYFGGRTYGTSPEQLRDDLEKIRKTSLPESLKEKEPEYFETAWQLADALFEQLMLSQQLMKAMYRGASGTFLHSHLLEEACSRSEAILRKVLDLAMEGALGKPRSDLRA